MTEHRRRKRSIKRRLLMTLLAAVAMTWVAAVVWSYIDARHQLDELLDAHLAQSATMLVVQAGHELEEIDTEHAPQLHPYARRVAFQVWENGGILRLHSVSAPNQRLSRQEQGFSDAEADGKRWRVFSTWDDEGELLIQVGEQYEVREQIAAGIARTTLTPLLFALPVLGFLIWASVDRATRPLIALSRQVAQRDPRNLTSLDIAQPPAELAPLVDSLDRLFARVRLSIDSERRFTADAAHELRTPLAAIRAQAQVAANATIEAEHRRALDNVIVGCDRAAHLVEQLLTLARLEPGEIADGREPCELTALARSVMAELAPMALSKALALELSDSPPVYVAGNASWLGILLRNLIDNAIRYSPPQTMVSVGTGIRDRQAVLTVEDQGPGIAIEHREGIGQRFHRILGSEEPGSGLGLSIVHRIAEIHDACVTYGDGSGGRGLRVTVEFPLAGSGRST